MPDTAAALRAGAARMLARQAALAMAGWRGASAPRPSEPPPVPARRCDGCGGPAPRPWWCGEHAVVRVWLCHRCADDGAAATAAADAQVARAADAMAGFAPRSPPEGG